MTTITRAFFTRRPCIWKKLMKEYEMETYTLSADILIEQWHEERSIENLKNALSEFEGILHVDINGQKIHVEYYPYSLSRSQICETISSLGCTLVTPEKKKGFISRYLGNVAEANKKQFGNGPLDCCNIKK
jgi:hypothetical protein